MTFATHTSRMYNMFAHAYKNIRFGLTECFFAGLKVYYLRTINTDALKTNPGKVNAILARKPPATGNYNRFGKPASDTVATYTSLMK